MPETETHERSITSAANPLLKEIRRAVAHGGLTSDGFCIAETAHLLEEALRSDCQVGAVLYCGADLQVCLPGHRRRERPVRQTVRIPERLLRSISSTETAPGVIALVKPPVWTPSQLFQATPLLVILDAVQDPGNAGAIVRSAEAFGATGVLFLKGSASPHNPKTLRASAGSLFRMPMLHAVEPAAAVDLLR